MKPDDIIKMAKEAGFNPVSYTGANLELFERFTHHYTEIKNELYRMSSMW